MDEVYKFYRETTYIILPMCAWREKEKGRCASCAYVTRLFGNFVASPMIGFHVVLNLLKKFINKNYSDLYISKGNSKKKK